MVPGSRLTFQERVQIQALWGVGVSVPAIAVVLGRHRSSVWREVTRNNSYRHGVKHPGRRTSVNLAGLGGAYRWGYVAERAQGWADARARRPRPVKCAPGSPVRVAVLAGLGLRGRSQPGCGWTSPTHRSCG